MKRFYLFVLLVTAVLTGCQSTDNTVALASEAVSQKTYNLSEQEVLEKLPLIWTILSIKTRKNMIP